MKRPPAGWDERKLFVMAACGFSFVGAPAPLEEASDARDGSCLQVSRFRCWTRRPTRPAVGSPEPYSWSATPGTGISTVLSFEGHLRREDDLGVVIRGLPGLEDGLNTLVGRLEWERRQDRVLDRPSRT